MKAWRARLAWAFITVISATGCASGSAPGRATSSPRLSDAALTHLAALDDRAKRAPRDADAAKRAGLAYMRATLAGVRWLQPKAERWLERAFELDPRDRQVSRSLGRFYNMRTVNLDVSKAEAQVEVYAALLGDESPDTMPYPSFVAYAFSQMGRALAAYGRGRSLRALRIVRALERELDAKVRQYPANIEYKALAGNFALFFAGNLPAGKRKRIRRGVALFEAVRVNWDRLRPGARDSYDCPNTYDNFMFELAEGHLALGDTTKAAALYRELSTPQGPMTRPRDQIAQVSRERLSRLDRYAGDLRLMPPWPSDGDNCVVCHSYDGEVSGASLHALSPMTWTETDPVVLPVWPRPAAAPVRPAPQLPAAVAEVLKTHCQPCHFPGGQQHVVVDLADPGHARRWAPWAAELTRHGLMPPTGSLPARAQQTIERWAAEVARAP